MGIRAPRLSALVVSTLVFAASCRGRSEVDFGSEPGDLVILAIAVGPEIRSVKTFVAGPDPLERLALAPDEAAHAFRVRARDLIGPDGAPLDPLMLASVHTSAPGAATAGVEPPRAGLPPGSCGRCLDPALEPPMIVHPGDRCALPPFATAFTDAGPAGVAPDAIAAVRGALRLEWPGECPCVASRPGPGPALDFDVIAPEPGFWPPERVGVTPRGDVGVFGAVSTMSFALDGRRREIPVPHGAGPLLAAAGLRGGGWISARSEPSQQKTARIEILGPDLSVRATEEALPSHVEMLLSLSSADGAVLIGGERESLHPSLFSCALDERTDRFDCAELIPAELRTSVRKIDAAIELPDGAVVALSDRAAVFAIQRAVPPARFRGTQSISTSPNDTLGAVEEAERGPAYWRWAAIDTPEVRFNDADAIGAIGQRVFVCVGANDEDDVPDVSVVLSATISAASLGPGSPPPAWRDTGCVFDGHCDAFSAVPGRPDRILHHFADNRSIELDQDGRVVSSGDPCARVTDPIVRELGRSLQRVVSAPGWTVAVEDKGSIFRRSTRTATAPMVQVYGPAIDRDTQVGAIAALGEDLFAFGRGGAGFVISSAAPRRPEPFQIAGVDPTASPAAAQADHAKGSILVAWNVHGAAGFLSQVRPRSSGAFDAERIDAPAALFPPSVRIVDMTEVMPGVFVLVLDGARVVRFDARDGAAERFAAIPIRWDDPGTAAIEDPPAALDGLCDRRRIIDERPEALSDDLFRAIDSSGGVAFAVGCRGVLFRISPFHSAQRVSFDRPAQSLFVPGRDMPPPLTAVRALCPDQAVFGSRGLNDFTDEEGRIWGLGPSTLITAPAGTVLPPDGLLLEELSDPLSTSASLFGLSAGNPVALLGDHDGLLGVFYSSSDGTLLRLGTPDRLSIYDPFIATARTEGGRILLATRWGRLLVSR